VRPGPVGTPLVTIPDTKVRPATHDQQAEPYNASVCGHPAASLCGMGEIGLVPSRSSERKIPPNFGSPAALQMPSHRFQRPRRMCSRLPPPGKMHHERTSTRWRGGHHEGSRRRGQLLVVSCKELHDRFAPRKQEVAHDPVGILLSQCVQAASEVVCASSLVTSVRIMGDAVVSPAKRQRIGSGLLKIGLSTRRRMRSNVSRATASACSSLVARYTR